MLAVPLLFFPDIFLLLALEVSALSANHLRVIGHVPQAGPEVKVGVIAGGPPPNLMHRGMFFQSQPRARQRRRCELCDQICSAI